MQNIDPGYLFHIYKEKKLSALIAKIDRMSDDDPTKRFVPALLKYLEIAQTFEKRWGEDNEASSLSRGAMKEIWEVAQREA